MRSFYEAAKINARLQRYPEALGLAEEGLNLDIDSLGTDHDEYHRGKTIVTALKSIQSSQTPFDMAVFERR